MCVVCICVYVMYLCCFVYACVGCDLGLADSRKRDKKMLEAGVDETEIRTMCNPTGDC